MTNKGLLLDILLKAKDDYKTSLKASRGLFSFPTKTYKRLMTDKGLCNYFQKAHNVCNLMDKHLLRFKPDSVTSGYWFDTKSAEGLRSRLEVIEKAITYYTSMGSTDVPLILHNTYLENVILYNACENGSLVTPETQEIYLYFMENIDHLDESREGDK
jgi:hypothetical protein